MHAHRNGTPEITKTECLHIIFKQIITWEDLTKELVLGVTD